MQAARSAVSLGGSLVQLGLCVAMGAAIVAGGGRFRAEDSGTAKADPVALGYEIFNREWLPHDSRSQGGDGLGPVYNDTSCVACHNAGGSGGAGPVSKNIDILSVSAVFMKGGGSSLAGQRLEGLRGRPNEAQSRVDAKQPRASIDAVKPPSHDTLADFHAGFRASRTAVLHKFGTDPNYDAWRSRLFNRPAKQVGDTTTLRRTVEVNTGRRRKVSTVDNSASAGRNGQAAEESPSARGAARIEEIRESLQASLPAVRQTAVEDGDFTFIVSRSQRSPTPLFGLGLIDSIPDAAIEKVAMEEARTSPETKGRASRLKDGRVGRLGWKGQTANTEDFVLNACAVELGLEVPGHSQAVIPQAPKYRPPGLDLNADECAALVAYVRSLPAPVERRPTDPTEAKYIQGGRALFTGVGCTNCHMPKLGDVAGIYSDLLLHDMGSEMGDDGSYDPGDSSDDPLLPNPEIGSVAAGGLGQKPASRTTKGATKQEWRTPPLWGFRDSGPYLHDGRAQTLEQAVVMHGGQGEASARKFLELTPKDRLQVESFLKSLVAPPSVQLARRGE
jgi:CxxC motif-containing protein (DUF1111 family)